jgi:hypothetical protein
MTDDEITEFVDEMIEEGYDIDEVAADLDARTPPEFRLTTCPKCGGWLEAAAVEVAK